MSFVEDATQEGRGKQSWLSVLLGVVQDAEAALAKQFEEVERMRFPSPPNSMTPESGVRCFLEALRKGCWLLMYAKLWEQEEHDRRQNNNEQQQARVLYDVLDDVRWSGLFDTGDMAELIFILRRVCWNIVDPSWREDDARGT